MQGLTGQVALVTGGGSGIGRAIVHRLAEAGAMVIIADVDHAAAQAVAQEVEQLGEGAGVGMDVTDAGSVEAGVEAVHRTAGPVSLLVNNAGVGTPGTVLTTQPEEFRRIMTVNVYGMFLVTRAVLPDMLDRHGGTIVNVASVAGLVGIQNRAAYSASKGAVLALTRSLHADFHKEGIRVNAVVPGTVDTPWVERITRAEADPQAAVAAMTARQPIGRMGTPEEIADAVYFLATPMSRFMYGSWLVVDGGLTAL
jgi:NAD(P)-dependent dehydrogenase (short-subunit alcohol dehydrogenase family)